MKTSYIILFLMIGLYGCESTNSPITLNDKDINRESIDTLDDDPSVQALKDIIDESGVEDQIRAPIDDFLELSAFKIVASNGEGGETDENPSVVEDSEFLIDWVADEFKESYSITTYLSADEKLDLSDIEFYSKDCTTLETCANDAFSSVICTISDDAISCPGGVEEGVDVSALLDDLPKKMNLIIEACDKERKNCDTLSSDLTFTL